MISRLHIENIAIMDNGDLELGNGFLALTGETGAGKSVIIDSVNLLTGERSSKSLVKQGKEKAFVEGTVFVENPEVFEILEENGIPYYEGEDICLSREINADGRTTVRINGKISNTGTLKSICSKIINIHGQNDNQEILDEKFHLEFIDSYGKLSDIKDEYGEIYSRYKECLKALKDTDEDQSIILQKTDMLNFKIKEIEDADLKIGEEEELLDTRNRFLNMEKLQGSAMIAKKALSGDENSDGAKSLIDIASKAIDDLKIYVPGVADFFDDLELIKDKIWDIAETVSDLADSFGQEEIDINYVESRLDLINRLKKKYGNNIEEILIAKQKAEEELFNLTNISFSREELEKKEKEFLEKLRLISGKLRKARQAVALKIEKEVNLQLKDLEMPDAEFKISLTETEFTKRGSDKAEFLISANKGQGLKPLNKTASGGELSRIILALKVILAKEDKVTTLIFDEVDAGVSGSVAQKIAEKLKLISNDKQVIVITHLAQIASFADSHYLVTKSKKDNETVSDVAKLDYEGRVKEIARIMSGSVITDTILKGAREMIKTGEIYGESIRTS